MVPFALRQPYTFRTTSTTGSNVAALAIAREDMQTTAIKRDYGMTCETNTNLAPSATKEVALLCKRTVRCIAMSSTEEETVKRESQSKSQSVPVHRFQANRSEAKSSSLDSFFVHFNVHLP